MRITKRFQFLILLTILIVAGRAAAQTGCLDFEDFPEGPVFGPLLGNSPGDTVFTQDGLQAVVQEIQYANGTTGFSNGQIQGSNINWLDGQFLFMGNNAIELHYTGGVQTVCFDFFDGGGEENVSVNGSPVAVLQQFTEVENLAIPGVEIELALDSVSSGGFLSSGTVCFSGDIESLLIGGQEFGVDNVCALAAEGSSGDCIEFEGMQTPGYGDGNTMPGAVFYEESGVNLRLAPFQTLFWTSTFGFLNVLEQPGFAAASGQYVQFDNISAIFDFTQYPETVEEVAVDFQYDPSGDGSVNFAANGAPFLIQFNLMPGFYALAPGVDLEVTYTNNSMTEGELFFTGNIQSLLIGGANGLSIDNVCVNPPPPCPIDNLALEVGECNPNGVFDLAIDFDYAGLPSDTVVLSVNGDEQLYLAGDFPVVFSPFVAIPDTFVFELSLPGIEGCSVTEELYPPFCDDEPCPPSTFEAIVGECSANGSFPVTFEYTGDADTVQLSNSVSNSPVVVPGDIVNELENSYNVDSQLNVIIFELQELDGDGCYYIDTVAVPYCESCLLIATLESGPVCSATGQYTVGINVYSADIGDTLTVTSSETGTVQNIPFLGNAVTLTLPAPEDNFDEITICPYDAPSPDCCMIFSYDLPCEGGCGLGEAFLAADTVSCNGDGTYDAALFVENLNAGEEAIATSLSTGFSENLITEVTGGEYLQITGWPVPEYGADSLEICLVDQPNCCTYTAFGVDCPPVECNFEAEVSLLSCDPGGVMTFEVTTSSDDPAVGQYVNILIGDVQYGLVSINTTVEVGLVINDGFDEIDVVIENWSGFASGPICSIVETVDVSSCVSSCAGPAFEAYPAGCSESLPGAYELDFQIFPDTNATTVYDIYSNGEVLLQPALLPNGSITLEVFPYDPGYSPDLITVCYHEEPECCTSMYVYPPNCECANIQSMTATMLPCEENGEYFVDIDLDIPIDVGYPFQLEVDGEYFDTYYPEDLPIIVGPFAGNGEPHEFYAQGDGECEGAGATVDGQFCDSDCPIAGIEVVTEPSCANTNGSFYYATLELIGVNAPGDSVLVTSQVTGETTLGVLDPNGSSVFDFNLPNTNQGFDAITVCLYNQPNCCVEIDYDINCPPFCDIQEWVIEPQGCQADGTFALYVDVVYEGAPTSIEVLIPELNFAEVYGLDEFPLEIPGFVGNGWAYEVNIAATDCGALIEELVEFPDCGNGGGCAFDEVIVEPHPCEDGEFFVDIEVQVDEPGTLGYYVFGDGEIFGPFSYDEPFVTVGPFAGDGESVYDFLLLDIADPACFGYAEFGPRDCDNDNCPIDNVTVDFAFCDTTGFYVELDFDGPAPNTAGSYRIFGNGETYDTLGYDAPRPIIVGPFDPYTDNIYELIVADLQQPNCSDFVEFPAFDCEEGEEVCIDFNAFDGFTAVGDGDGTGLIGVESGVEIRYEALPNNFPTALTVEDNLYPAFAQAEESIVIFSNAKVGFEAGPLPAGVSSRTMTMDFHFPVWVDSMQVYANGDSQYVYLPLPTNPGEVQLGDDITMSFDYSTPATTGKITVEGPVESLYFSLLPNYTMALDNLCITNVIDEVCGIENVEVEVLGCDENGLYRLLLDFEADDADGYFFRLYVGDGNSIGLFPFNQLPLELEGFGVADGDADSLKICINNNPACCVNVVYEVPDCESELGAECVTFEIYDGQASESSSDFMAEEYGVAMKVNNSIYSFESGTIPAFSSADSTFLHLTTGQFQLSFEDYLERSVSLDYYLHEDVDSLVLWTASSVDRIMLPILQDTSLMTPGGLSLDFIVDSPQTGHLQVSGISTAGNWNYFQIGGFGASREMAIDNLCIDKVSGSNCEITNLSAAATGCGGDGLYNLMVDFEVSNPGLDSFNLYDANDSLVGQFSTSSLPLLIEDYGTANISPDAISVCLSNVLDCCQSTTYGVIDCAGSNDVCLSFDIFEGEGASGWPIIDPLFGIENGVQIKHDNGDFCDCYINMPSADEVPDFETANGAVAQVNTAALWFELPEEAEGAKLDFEFYEDSDCVILFDGENFQDGISLSSLTPGVAAESDNGVFVTLNYLTDEVDERTATIEIDGIFSTVRFLGSGYIDNFCYTPADQEVWPGDANADNIAQHIDLLSIGLGYNAAGPARLEDGTGWMPAVAANWDSSFVDGTNYKHADCNGDGIIDAEDRTAILVNYGLEHGTPQPFVELPGTDTDPPAYIDMAAEQEAGASFEAPIVVGEMDQAVEDVYGIAFTVTFDPEIIDPNAIEVIYPTSWFGEPGVNTLTVHKVYEEGKIEIALTRTDHNNVSGHGTVAYIIGIIDDIAGYHDSKVDMSHLYAIDKGEARLPLQGRSTAFTVDAESSTPALGAEGAFSLFPNPTSDWVNIHSVHGFRPDALELHSIDGRRLPVRTDGTNQRVSLEGLPQGTYVLQITSGRATVRKRVIKQ